ncbi:MAG: primosomal protein N', partial [Anaerolineae bacterium]
MYVEYADVVVTRPTHRRPPPDAAPLRDEGSRLITYTYRLPERLRGTAAVGHLVQIPLRHGMALGVILALSDEPPAGLPPGVEIRDLDDILDPLPVVTTAQIALARWVADAYVTPLNQAIRLFLPPGLEERTYLMVSEGGTPAARHDLPPDQAAALAALESAGGRSKLSTLLRRIPGDDPEGTIGALADRGLLDTHHRLVPPRPAPPRVEYVRLLADDATIETELPRLGHASKQADVLSILARRAGAPPTLAALCAQAGCSDGPVRALAEQGWVEITPRRTLVVPVPGARDADLGRAYRQAEVLAALLHRGRPVEWPTLAAETGASSSIVKALEEKGLVRRLTEEPAVILRLPPDRVPTRVIELHGAERHAAVLRALQGSTERVWVGGIYAQTGADLGVLRDLAERGLVSLHAEPYDRPKPAVDGTAPRLTPGQAAAWRQIEATIGTSPSVVLLHGVTGSGKTELYLRALEATLAVGRRAIVLVPEISLTPQTVQRFEARFPGRVAVTHSQLSLGRRYAAWDRVRRGEADVVIGPRSALLAPVSRLGLIVLDEAHDDAFKQDAPIPLPPYHARDAAVALGRIASAPVILGSATPDVVTYYRATGPGAPYRLVELPRRIVAHGAAGAPVRTTGALPPVRVVDLRQELRAGNRSIFSRALQRALQRTLDAGEQAILFLNRRGAATFVLCRDCGYVARCPRCDVPLTYHHLAAAERLVCHHCDYQAETPQHCPACGGARIRYFGLGTERVEEAMRALCPEA